MKYGVCWLMMSRSGVRIAQVALACCSAVTRQRGGLAKCPLPVSLHPPAPQSPIKVQAPSPRTLQCQRFLRSSAALMPFSLTAAYHVNHDPRRTRSLDLRAREAGPNQVEIGLSYGERDGWGNYPPLSANPLTRDTREAHLFNHHLFD